MNCLFFKVLLEIGREGGCFTYKDGLGLGVGVGDLVQVRLRGREMNGLVIQKCFPFDALENSHTLSRDKEVEFLDIDEIVHKSVVDSSWKRWIDATAKNCHVSSFRMLKAALPTGWLGERKKYKSRGKSMLWVSLKKNKNFEPQKISRRKRALEEVLKSSGGGAWQKDLQASGFSTSLIQSLVLSGIASKEKRFVFDEVPSIHDDALKELEKIKILTNEQQNALNTYHRMLQGESLLLWGVTGSGKTEVYLQIVAHELKSGRHCLILTPEIGLIPQLLDRFTKRFGSRVLEYHSNLSNREKLSTWMSIVNASTPFVVIGTRSAVFLPLKPLGLITLDEEHDSSYKQESPMPCYHARDIACERAKRCGAKVVLGSATPSLSTWKNISKEGSLKVARLNQRISNQALPRVKIIDMRNELAQGHRRLISRQLMAHLSALRESGEQAVLLVPRRGYSTFVSCRSCGEVVQCPNCDVALTVHRNAQGMQWLRCHWCDYRSGITSKCHECGSNAFKPFGAGTQRVMENLENELEGLRFLRFDRDTTGGRDGHRKLLNQFADGKADVLIGTQMLSKGMDLPNVTLAAVLAADGLLHKPDLMSGEQTLQLFLQLAGRAGRGNKPGEVLVQTYCPDHPVITHLVNGSYEDFLIGESQLRKEAGLVPYSRACLLRLAGESSSLTAQTAIKLSENIKKTCNVRGWNIVGPAPSLISKVAGKSRWQILLHGPESSLLPFSDELDLWKFIPKGVTLSVDPDPMQL